MPLQGLGNLVRPDASGADLYALDASVLNRLQLLKVREPHTAGLVVSVTDVIAEAGAFAADFAYLGHDKTSSWKLSFTF